MRHLHLVPATGHGPPSAALTAPAATPHALPELLTPSPELAALFERCDDLFDGLDPSSRRAAVSSMYFDAGGNPRARSLNLRLV